MRRFRTLFTIAFALASFSAIAADYPAPKEADWIARDFKFHTGEVMQEIRLHYTTVGESSGQPVLVLHGSGRSAAGMLTPEFAGQLFGPGQPVDATKYYIIIPDSIGHGKSSKPSDSLKTKFPKYDYADMVDAQYRLLTEDRHPSCSPYHRQFYGRHADVALGREISWIHGCAGADGIAAYCDGKS
jgi:homoserine O-acetyltransferase